MRRSAVGIPGGSASQAGSSGANSHWSRVPCGIPSTPRTTFGSASSRYGSTTRSQMTACSGIRPIQAFGTSGRGCVVALRGIDEDVGHRQAAPKVGRVAGEVAAGRHHLHAREAHPHEGLVAAVVPELRGELHRVLADLPGPHDRHPHRVAVLAHEPRPLALQGGEGGRDAVPGDAAQVLDEPAAVVVRDHVEGDPLDAEVPRASATRAGRVGKWSIETRTAPRRIFSYRPSGARRATMTSWR